MAQLQPITVKNRTGPIWHGANAANHSEEQDWSHLTWRNCSQSQWRIGLVLSDMAQMQPITVKKRTGPIRHSANVAMQSQWRIGLVLSDMVQLQPTTAKNRISPIHHVQTQPISMKNRTGPIWHGATAANHSEEQGQSYLTWCNCSQSQWRIGPVLSDTAQVQPTTAQTTVSLR